MGCGPHELRRLKPDPLNLSVNTGAGKQIIKMIVFDECFPNEGGHFIFYKVL